MKKLLKFTFLLFTLSCSSLSAQVDYHDVVYLKNGSIIHGIIIEQAPNKYIKIKTTDNNVWVFQMEEIEKITKELNENYKFGRSSSKRKGYFNYERLGILTGQGETIFAVGSINGVKMGNHFAMGFGVEYNNYPNATVMPLFLDLRVNYLSSSITPISFVDIGYSLGWIKGMSGTNGNGFFLNIGSGVEFQLNNNVSMHLDLSWRKQWSEEYYEYSYSYYDSNYPYQEHYVYGSGTSDITYNFFSLMLGVSF